VTAEDGDFTIVTIANGMFLYEQVFILQHSNLIPVLAVRLKVPAEILGST